MATVQRANVILQIPDEADIIQKYRDKGYDIIDPVTGKVIEKAVPQESGALRAYVLNLQKELVGKDAIIESLQKEIAKLKAKKTVKANKE